MQFRDDSVDAESKHDACRATAAQSVQEPGGRGARAGHTGEVQASRAQRTSREAGADRQAAAAPARHDNAEVTHISQPPQPLIRTQPSRH